MIQDSLEILFYFFIWPLMLFNSLEFIFLFLPAAVFLFYASKKINFQLSIVVLTLFSFFYYAYWNPPYIILLLGSIGLNYLIAGFINIDKGSKKFIRLLALVSAIAANMVLLFYFKYTSFIIENYSLLTNSRIDIPHIILPIGISFFTFQQIAYQIDIYKGKVTSHNFWEYCLFVSFFPQLIAGPIVHHNEMLPQFKRRSGRPFHTGNLVIGMTIFTIGLFKKVVIADNLAFYANPIFEDAIQGQSVDFYAAWIGALGYTLQLYFDFSGYSDMAIGAARMFGIRLPINFFSPYKASSIIDFWRRWHITLSRFFRDYLYIPLGGNRKGVPRQITNIFITMVLVGFWHGAGWTFIIWGAYHGGLILINHLWRHYRGHKKEQNTPSLLGSVCLTFLLVVIGWIFFRAESLNAAIIMLKGIAGLNGLSLPVHFFLYGLVPEWLPATVSVAGAKATILIIASMFIAFFLPNTAQIMKKFRPALMPRYKLYDWSILSLRWQPNILWALYMTILFLWAVASIMSGETEFLYYNF